MLTVVRNAPRTSRTLPLLVRARGYTTAAELERGEISRTVQRTIWAKRDPSSGGAVVHNAIVPRDKQSPFLACVISHASLTPGSTT